MKLIKLLPCLLPFSSTSTVVLNFHKINRQVSEVLKSDPNNVNKFSWNHVGELIKSSEPDTTIQPNFFINYTMDRELFNYWDEDILSLCDRDTSKLSSFFTAKFDVGSSVPRRVKNAWKRLATEISEATQSMSRYYNVKFTTDSIRVYMISYLQESENNWEGFQKIFDLQSLLNNLSWEHSPYTPCTHNNLKRWLRRDGGITLQIGFTAVNWYKSRDINPPVFKVNPGLIRVLPNKLWINSVRNYYKDSFFMPKWSFCPPRIFLQYKSGEYIEYLPLSSLLDRIEPALQEQFHQSFGIKIQVIPKYLKTKVYNTKLNQQDLVNIEFCYQVPTTHILVAITKLVVDFVLKLI